MDRVKAVFRFFLPLIVVGIIAFMVGVHYGRPRPAYYSMFQVTKEIKDLTQKIVGEEWYVVDENYGVLLLVSQNNLRILWRHPSWAPLPVKFKKGKSSRSCGKIGRYCGEGSEVF